ncbi:MAG TPA: ATPase, T2SS/T4P/T4SS family [Planctomycetota bacterium]
MPVGKFFLDQGKITPQQLELALKHRAEFHLKLGQSLVELGFVTEADMVEALRYQARFPCVHLTSGIVDARIARKVGEPFSRKLRAIALSQFAGHTTIALEDPSNEETLLELSHLLGTRIFAVYAEPSAIRRQIELVFGHPARKPAARPPEPVPPPLPATAPAMAAPVPPPVTAHAPPAVPAAPAAPAPEPRAARAEPVPAGEAPDERAVVERVRSILMLAFEQGVSAIHLEARRGELCVRFRLAGALLDHCRLPAGWAAPTFACLKSLAKLEGGEAGAARRGIVPFVFKKRRMEVEMATLPAEHGECAVLHVRDGERVHLRLAELGLGEEQRTELAPLLATERGLLLVAGPPGSGRATTLHALLEKLAAPGKKVVVLDERDGHDLEGVVHARVDGRTGLDYARGVQRLLAQDPDLLVVGEIDGRESARALVRAALERRVVLSSLFASGALDVLTRLQRLGLEPYLLAETLRGVVAQRVLRLVCPDCREPVVPTAEQRANLDLADDGAVFQRGEGCASCARTGHRGLLRLFEVLALTPGLRRELEKGSGPEALARVAVAEGFRPLRTQGLERARAGLTTLEEVLVATSGV